MSKFQNVNFRAIEDLLDYLPEPEREIVISLRNIIFECMPDCVEKLAYNVPYYYRNSRVCFIWPASVPWGSVKHAGVVLGFTKGNMLADSESFLDKGTRKQVFTKTFHSPKEIDRVKIELLLKEASLIDDLTKSKKKR